MSALTTIPFGALRARVPRPPQPHVRGVTSYTPNMIYNSLGCEVQLRAYLHTSASGYLSDAYPIPVVPRLHTQIRDHIADGAGGNLDMTRWHGSDGICGTAHCWAGWVVHLAGAQGAALEQRTVCSAAARLIMLASCDYLTVDTVPDFHSCADTARATIARYAEMEQHDTVESVAPSVTLMEDLWPRPAVVGVYVR